MVGHAITGMSVIWDGIIWVIIGGMMIWPVGTWCHYCISGGGDSDWEGVH
jgi:hypothetical protein